MKPKEPSVNRSIAIQMDDMPMPVPKPDLSQDNSLPIKIVILQRGWNMIGRFERNGADCKLYNASVIRVWGTTKGLGEIAADGPTKDTILDKTYGVVEFDYLTVVATIAVREDKWKRSV